MECALRCLPMALSLGLLLCSMAAAQGEWRRTGPGSGQLTVDGDVLLEVSPPTGEQVQVYAEAGPWTAEGGVVEYRRRVPEDVFAIHGAPLEATDIIVAGDVTIREGGVAGLAVRSDREGKACYGVLLAADSDLVRVAPIPWPGHDFIAIPHPIEARRAYHLEVWCEETAEGTHVRVLLDGEEIVTDTDSEFRPTGGYVGAMAHTCVGTVGNVTAWSIENGKRGRELLSSDQLDPIGDAPEMPAEDFGVSYEDGALVFETRLPKEGHGLGALARIVHGIEGASEIHIPHLAPTPGYIIADHSYRSPAAVFSNGKRALALVPDIDDVRMGHLTGLKSWMDYDHPERAITVALGNYRLGDVHVLYNALPLDYHGQETKVRVHVLTSTDPADLANPYGMAARFIWDRWGHPLQKAGGAQRAPFENYMAYIVQWAFSPEGWEDVWQSFEIDGRECGSPAFIMDVAQHPSIPVNERRWREQRSVWNQAWFSTQRCANGLLRYARQIGSQDLERRAHLMTSIALAAPQTDGLFPEIYSAGGGRYQLHTETADWDQGHWTNSNRRPPDTSVEACHILDASFTARLLLEWSDLVGGDEEATAYVKRYLDRLVRLQHPNGAFPGWVEPDGSVPETLAEGPESAMSVALLYEACEHMGANARWREAADRGLEYLKAGPVAQGRWEDYETYFSCGRYWGDHVGEPIPRNGIFKRNTLSMFWCAEAFMAAYRTDGDEENLAIGRRCLDELSFYQQVWDPPFIPAPCHGGFGVMNGDGEWNDARQSLFAPIYLDYYEATGNSEYFERAVAALRSSFAMLYCPENEQVRKQYERRYDFFGPESYGFMMENISHGGPGSEPIGPFTIYTWGNGAALATAALFADRYGDAYVDDARGRAFGINGCRADQAEGGTIIRDVYRREQISVQVGDDRETVEISSGTARVTP